MKCYLLKLSQMNFFPQHFIMEIFKQIAKWENFTVNSHNTYHLYSTIDILPDSFFWDLMPVYIQRTHTQYVLYKDILFKIADQSNPNTFLIRFIFLKKVLWILCYRILKDSLKFHVIPDCICQVRSCIGISVTQPATQHFHFSLYEY